MSRRFRRRIGYLKEKLADLGTVFRSHKSEPGFGPVYRHKEERVDGHLFITLLACQFVQVIRRRPGNCQIDAS